MSDESRAFLKKYLPDTLQATKLSDILGPLYDLIMDKGFKEKWEDGYNAFGEKAQEVYDDIFYSNATD